MRCAIGIEYHGAMTLSVHFEEALVFATRLHAAQRRKGTSVPYIAHLLAVAGIVLDYGAPESVVVGCCARLATRRTT